MAKAGVILDPGVQKSRRWITRYEALLLAAAPGVGILIALLDQLGRFLFLDVPPTFVELDPGKVVFATVGVLVVAGTYATLWAEELRSHRPASRLEIIGSHLFVNSALALFLVMRNEGVFQWLPSMVTVAFGLTVVTYWGQMLSTRIKRAAQGVGTRPTPTNIAMFLICAILAVVAVVTGSSYNSERKQISRLVVQGEDKIFVGTYDGQYILKPFNPVTMSLVSGAVSLQTPEGKLDLEMVNLELRPTHNQRH